MFQLFHYFPSLEYAKETLVEFIRLCKPGGHMFVGDVPDERMKAAALNYRQKGW
jgi:hypothetical protein